jgi:hypothetical protein
MSAPQETPTSDPPVSVEDQLLTAVMADDAKRGAALVDGDQQPGYAAPKDPDPEPVAPGSQLLDVEPEATPDPKKAEGDEPDPKKAEGDEPEPDPEPEDPDAPIETFAQLAQAYEQEPDVLLAHLTVPDAEGNEVPLAEIVSAFRKAPEAVRIANEVQAKEAELEAQIQENTRVHDAAIEHLRETTIKMVEEVEQEKPLTDAQWDELRESDPEQYLLQRDKYTRRREAFEASLQQLQADEDARAADRKKFRVAEMRKVIAKIPAWHDKEKGEPSKLMETEIGQIQTYCQGLGFTEDQFELLDDSRVMLAMRNAMLYDQLESQSSLTLKRVRDTPRGVLKGGARKPPGSAKKGESARETRALQERLSETGHINDAARLFERFV